MIGRIILPVLATVLIACDGGDSPSQRAASPEPVISATPDPRAYVYDLANLQPVYDVAGLGRVPLGLINTVAIRFADARFDGFYAGEELPSAEYLTLSIVTSAARTDSVATNGRTHQASYEWWFRIENLDVATIPADDEPDLRVAMRETAPGVWALYAETASGSTELTEATYNVGVFEVSAEVPLDDAWGMDRNKTTTFFRAVTRYDLAVAGDDRVFGWVFPEDGGWREVFYY